MKDQSELISDFLLQLFQLPDQQQIEVVRKIQDEMRDRFNQEMSSLKERQEYLARIISQTT